VNDITSWPPAVATALGGLLGALVGAVNAWMLAGPFRQMARVGGDSERADILQQQILLRYLLRMSLSFVSLLVVFLVLRQSMALVATLLGLVVVGDIPLFFLTRARRERP